MSTSESPLLRQFLAAEQDNLGISFDRLTGTIALAGQIDALMKTLGDLANADSAFSQARTFEVDWLLFGEVRVASLIATSLLFRGHLTGAGAATRRLVELAATGWRIHREPDLQTAWLAEPGDAEWKRHKKAFSTQALFPKNDVIVGPLYERYKVLNSLVHASVTSLARRFVIESEGNVTTYTLRLFELDANIPSEPTRSFLYLIQTVTLVIDVFAAMWHQYLGVRSHEWQSARTSFESALQNEIARWKPILQEDH